MFGPQKLHIMLDESGQGKLKTTDHVSSLATVPKLESIYSELMFSQLLPGNLAGHTCTDKEAPSS